MKEIRLAKKKVLFDKSPIVFSYKPDEKWKDYFDVKSGNWYYEDGAIIGFEPDNKGGILFTKEFYKKLINDMDSWDFKNDKQDFKQNEFFTTVILNTHK